MYILNNKRNSTNSLFRIPIALLIILLLLFFLSRNTSLFYRKSIILPFSLHLNRQDLYMAKGEEFRLFVYGINKRVSFHSTNFRVAGVNFNGRVFAYKTGKAFIIAKVDKKELKCRVRVIDLNKKRLSLDVGSSYRLKVKGPAIIVSYKSSDASVASVNIFGNIKAKSPGKATITANIRGKKLKCNIRVK